jgi:hypothetical protein
MKSWLERAAALVCVVVCACGGAFPGALRAEPLRAHSRHDGATVWSRYDARGALAERQLDTNGDGRPDVIEYYRGGALLRRDSDRNFNGVTDLVEDFDEITQEPVRSIVDQDYDGTADLLLLYRNGEAVVSERAPAGHDRRTESVRQDRSTALVSLRNPFAATRAFDSSAVSAPRETWIGPAPTAGVAASAAHLPAPAPAPTSLPRSVRVDLNSHRSLRSPRGPPLA